MPGDAARRTPWAQATSRAPARRRPSARGRVTASRGRGRQRAARQQRTPPPGGRGEQAGRRRARSRGRPPTRGARGSCQPPGTSSPVTAPSTRAATPRPVVAQHPAGPDEQVDLAQVLAAALHDAGRRASNAHLACGPRAGAARPRRRPARPPRRRRRSASSRGQEGRVGLPNLGGARDPPASSSRPAATPSSTVGTALQRMPRSPSTVRLTGTVAITSRPSSAASGSSSTTECTSVVAPPTSTTTTSPAPGRSASRPPASSSTAVSTSRGSRPGPSGEVRPLRQVLAADHVAQEHLPDRGPGRGRARARRSAGPRCRPGRAACRRRPAARRPRAGRPRCPRPRPARASGPRRAVAQASRTSALPPSVPPTRSTTSGSAGAQRARATRRGRRWRRAPPGRRWTARPGARPRR